MNWINPVEGMITDLFGERENPILHKIEFHEGIDIGAPKGTDIVAVNKGIVLDVHFSTTYGNTLSYGTVDGYTVFYAHCEKILVNEGDTVEKGEVVAIVGDTGLSTGPHLHYGIIKDNTYIDPIDFVDLPTAIQ